MTLSSARLAAEYRFLIITGAMESASPLLSKPLPGVSAEKCRGTEINTQQITDSVVVFSAVETAHGYAPGVRMFCGIVLQIMAEPTDDL